jgi:hypothetical protein
VILPEVRDPRLVTIRRGGLTPQRPVLVGLRRLSAYSPAFRVSMHDG